MLNPVLEKDDKKAKRFIWIFSIALTGAIVFLTSVKPLDGINLGFNVHYFAMFNAIVNSVVSILLVWGLMAVKNKNYALHKKLMLTALACSVLFLVSYVANHLFAKETHYGGSGPVKYIYFVILITHIFLATVILPFILFTAYRALTGEFVMHKKLAKYTWPLWLYVSVTGPIVYLMISPYYT